MIRIQESNVRVDYILEDVTHVWWPGLLPYRDINSKQGYKSRIQAEQRAMRIQMSYAKKRGAQGGPQFRVRERTRWAPETVTVKDDF